MKVGEAITQLLAGYGTRHVFGIPGTHTLELYRGLARGNDLQHVLAHHEQGAGFMADGYARTTGHPGVCFVITGAGVTNMATPLGEAFSDSVPLLVISPINPLDGGGHNQGRLHEITDQSAVTAPLTAFSAIVADVDEIPDLVARAFAVFRSERPRPVHISIPLPLLGVEVGPWEPSSLPSMPVVPDEQMERAGEWIDAAQRPVIVAGGGTRFCAGAVVSLAEAIGCPVITTVAGRGVIPASHPLSAGAQLRASPVQDLLGEADLALLLGTELAQTDHWNDDLPIPRKQIRINIDRSNLLAQGEVIAMRGEVGDAAGRLCGKISAVDLEERTARAKRRCGDLRQSLLASMTAKEKRHWRVLEVVHKNLSDHVRIFSDMTQLAYTAIDFMPLEHANSWHHPTGYGTLGYALPAAIGGAIAYPSSQNLVIVGDAGLQYTMQELPLAAELGLNITILLWNNDALEQIKDDMEAAGIPPTGVKQRNPDFRLLAESCGWRYDRVVELAAFESSLISALACRGPCLLQIDEKKLFPR